MPAYNSITYYLSVYRSHLGSRLYIVFSLTAVAALMEGFGIALLLPLLRAAGSTSAEPPSGAAERALWDLITWLGVSGSIMGILFLIGGVFFLKGMVRFAHGAYNGLLQAQLLRELKTKLFDGYLRMDYRHYVARNTGHFINVINAQVQGFFGSFGNYIKFLATVITTIVYLAVAFVLAWRFALMALAVGSVVLILFGGLRRYVRGLSRLLSSESSHLSKLLIQALHSFKYIVATNQISHLRAGVMGSVQRLTDYTFRQRAAAALTAALQEPISILLIIAIVIVQVEFLNQELAPIFVAILLLHRGMKYALSIQSNWQATMDRIGSLEMVETELAEIRHHQEPTGGQVLPALGGRGIEFQNVSFSYDSESDVLQNVSLRIAVNTTVAFVGESGAGKSTLIDMLTLMLKPQHGEVRIGGQSFRDIDLRSWRSQIGYVSQETVVFDDTIANNISLWEESESPGSLRRRIAAAAQSAHAAEFIDALPDRYETVVGDRGVRLSGGQRQRLFIARELFKEPRLLILDEATSALDSESERYIQASIDQVKGAMTVVIIAHRLSTIKNADYIYVMDHGRIVEEGPFDELVARANSRFGKMVQAQSI